MCGGRDLGDASLKLPLEYCGLLHPLTAELLGTALLLAAALFGWLLRG